MHTLTRRAFLRLVVLGAGILVCPRRAAHSAAPPETAGGLRLPFVLPLRPTARATAQPSATRLLRLTARRGIGRLLWQQF